MDSTSGRGARPPQRSKAGAKNALSQQREAERRRTAAAQRKARAAKSAAAKRRWTVPVASASKRLTVGLVAVAVVSSLLMARAVQVQGLDPASNAGYAQSEALHVAIVPATRGTITDRHGEPLVSSEPAVNVFTDPTIVATNGADAESMSLRQQLKAQAGPGIIAGTLAYHLGGDFNSYYTGLTTTHADDGTAIRYAVLARSVRDYKDVLVNESLARLGYVGLFEEEAPVRLYPQGTLAADVLGFMVYDADLDAAHQYPWSGGGGLELALNTNLAGLDGQEMYETSSYARIPTATTTITEPQDGISYELTLDAGLQYMAELELQEVVERFQGDGGTAIVLDIKSGEILALASAPGFDPNDLAHADPAALGLDALTTVYEPGSVQKVLTMAALLDSGLITPYTQVEVPGIIVSGGQTIEDSWDHWTMHLTATGVLVQSSNVGTALMTRQIGTQELSDYLNSFGLGQLTGLDWPGEQTGYVPGGDMTGQTRDNIAFGQGLSVTAVQEAAAVAAVVNGGLYVSPTLIRSAWTSDGQPYEVAQPTTRQVISAEASADLLYMMEAAAATSIDGYRVAGKTGTAERFDENCGCYSGVVASFIGVAPAEDPQILVYVVVDNPKTSYSGLTIARPAALDLLRVALPRYGVIPSTEPAPEFITTW
jgi:cell division protein FtsI (penicillin-binding protein 3)